MKVRVALCLAAIAGSLVGCAHQDQANFRHPRPDELRPGDTAPPPGAFVDSMPRQRQYVPLPAPYLVPMPPPMPIRRQTVCNTQRFGNEYQTICR